MKTLLSLIFILSSTLSYSAGTDSGGSSSSNGGYSSSNSPDVNIEFQRAKKLIYKKEYEKVEIGKAEVRQIFKYSKAGKIAGCYVTEGMVKRDSLIEIFRNKKRVFEGQLTSLKRFKDDVKEVKSNYECGIVIDEFQDYEEGDRLVFLELREIPF